MNYPRLVLSYECFTLGMAAYGFSRGYRSVGGRLHHTEIVPAPSPTAPTSSSAPVHGKTTHLPLLFGQRIIGGMVNGVMYALPVWNAIHLFHLFNRLEINYRGYAPEKYMDEYHEWVGWCYDTL